MSLQELTNNSQPHKYFLPPGGDEKPGICNAKSCWAVLATEEASDRRTDLAFANEDLETETEIAAN